MSGGALPPVLEDYYRQIASVTAEMEALADRLPEAALAARPADGAWSVLEHMEHLRVTAYRYVPALEAAMTGAPAAPAGEWPGSYGFLWRFFVKALEPPVKKRFRAPAVFLPGEGLSAPETRQGFREAHRAILDQLHRAAAVDPREVKVISPANARLKLPLACAFEVLAAHARRHLWLARRAAGPAAD